MALVCKKILAREYKKENEKIAREYKKENDHGMDYSSKIRGLFSHRQWVILDTTNISMPMVYSASNIVLES